MISYIFICCLVFTCGCLRCSLQCWVESSWWQIDDDFGGNSPSQKLLFVFFWVCTWKRISWGQGASLLSIRCLWPHGQESERFPYHKKGTIYSLKILGRMKYSQPCHHVFLPRTFMWSLRNLKCEFWSAKTRHGTRKVKVVGSPICIRQHLQFVWSVNIFFQFNQTISLRSEGDPRMTGEISFCAKIQFESLGYLLFTGGVTGVLCFSVLFASIARILQEWTWGSWGCGCGWMRTESLTLCRLWLEMGYKAG